jgi:hypothetical protein
MFLRFFFLFFYLGLRDPGGTARRHLTVFHIGADSKTLRRSGDGKTDMVSTIVTVGREEPDEWIPSTSYSAIEWASLSIFRVDKDRIVLSLYFQIFT